MAQTLPRNLKGDLTQVERERIADIGVVELDLLFKVEIWAGKAFGVSMGIDTPEREGQVRHRSPAPFSLLYFLHLREILARRILPVSRLSISLYLDPATENTA